MSAKRFTDTAKWRKKWFRTLPVQAKLVWIYLCDECDLAGLLKPDYELASFQVGFDFNQGDLKVWFGEKIFFIDDESILLIPFFEFQYGQSKDTWSAKVKAKNILEGLGFQIIENQVLTPQLDHSDTTVGVESKTLLIKGVSEGIGRSKGIGNTGGDFEKQQSPNSIFPEKFNRKKLPRAAELWNANCGSLTKLMGTCRLWNKISDEVIAEYGEDGFVEGVKKAAGNTFLTGGGSRKWKATFSWIISKDHLAKVLAGDYDTDSGVVSMIEQLRKDLEAS